MNTSAPSGPTGTPGDDPDPESTSIGQFCTRPGRYVFAERNNSDGWIATSLTVVAER